MQRACPINNDTSSTDYYDIPDNKVHGASLGPIWGQQDPGGPHVGTMNFVIWDMYVTFKQHINSTDSYSGWCLAMCQIHVCFVLG